MVKSTFIVASTLALFSSLAVAQTPTIPAGVPTDLAAAASSLMAHPGEVQSMLASASQLVGSLPTQYQASAYSALAEASKTLAAVQPGSTQKASSGSNIKPVVAAVAAMAGVAAVALM